MSPFNTDKKEEKEKGGVGAEADFSSCTPGRQHLIRRREASSLRMEVDGEETWRGQNVAHQGTLWGRSFHVYRTSIKPCTWNSCLL